MSTTVMNAYPDLFFPYQRAWLTNPSRFKIGLWARQTGKDYTCAAEAVIDSVRTANNHWLIIACGERQAVESLQHARNFAQLLRANFRASKTELHFSNGSRITALPAKPETIRGYSANLILTEFAFHDHPDDIWRAVFPILTNPLKAGPRKLRIISTPNGHSNKFHTLWTSDDPSFFRLRITIHDAVAARLPINVEELKAGLLDAEAWAQEYECEFVDQSSVLLPYELMEGCEAAEATETSGVEDLSRSMDASVGGAPELYMGIDFGRKQDLTVCWVLEKLPGRAAERFMERGAGSVANSVAGAVGSSGSCLMTREVLVMRRTPTPEQMELLRPRVRLARRVCVDYTGAGIGLGDALAQEFGGGGGTNSSWGKVELCTFTAGLKEEIFVKLRAGFERRRVWIPRSAEIREDLHSMHRVVSATGQVGFRASRSADGHSDRCTALALALRAAENAPVSGGASSVGVGYRNRRW